MKNKMKLPGFVAKISIPDSIKENEILIHQKNKYLFNKNGALIIPAFCRNYGEYTCCEVGGHLSCHKNAIMKEPPPPWW